jgi:Holliday junction DNA helicase RuvB
MEDNNEKVIDSILRPKDWNDFVGQKKVKENLRIILEAANKRKEAPDHFLFYGSAGLGKTSLALLSSKQAGGNIKITSGPAIEKSGDLASILANLEQGDFLFIDEIHRLNKMIEEILYSAMESRVLNLILGKGPSARTVQFDLPPFTLIAATTRAGMISSPLRSRFGAIFKLDYYNQKEIEQIIRRSLSVLGIEADEQAIECLAKASRATPRTANRLLKRSRDLALVENKKMITKDLVKKTLEMLEIDDLGLEFSDRNILETIIDKFNGGPVGIGSLSAATNEERETIEEVYEPYLMRIGFIERTSKGRKATGLAYQHMNKYNQKKSREKKEDE